MYNVIHNNIHVCILKYPQMRSRVSDRNCRIKRLFMREREREREGKRERERERERPIEKGREGFREIVEVTI